MDPLHCSCFGVNQVSKNNNILLLRTFNSWLWEEEAAGPISLTNEWPPEENKVFATTIHSFKGLESSVVLLAEIERWPNKKFELENLLYVACSRARHHLIILRPVLMPKSIARYFA